MVHRCYVCKMDFPNFRAVLRHVLKVHRDELSEWEVKRYERALNRDYTCRDCIHCGNIYFDPIDEYRPLMKGCPKEYFFDCPNPAENCPNFWPREDRW